MIPRRATLAERLGRSLLPAAALLGLAVSTALAAGGASLRAPRSVSPASASVEAGVPAFGWTAVPGADRYEFGISADARFNSPVGQGIAVGPVLTGNTWATPTKLVPNGTYWWRVRAFSNKGAVSPWSAPRSFRRAWTAAPALLSPASGATITFPTTPLALRWSAVPYAATYLVLLASDPGLANLYGDKATETQATSFVPPDTLKVGTYYWAVIPVDAGGNRGTRSRVASFKWVWPSKASVRVADLVPAPEHYDPFFSWSPVPGSARYEIEVNPSQDFATGSTVCCDKPVLGTSFAPTTVLGNNKYYWRVRAIDVDGNAGQWNVGQPFTKSFDNVPPVPGTSIKNLHVRDANGDPGTTPPGFPTGSPIVVWSPVPGASAYHVEVVPFNTPARPNDCDWTADQKEHWNVITATTAWTPLGSSFILNSPYPAGRAVSKELPGLVAGHSYCARVRAVADQDAGKADVYGDYAYLRNAFVFTGYAPGGGAPTMPEGAYLEPAQGTVSRRMPFFTWRAIPGAASYYVLVAKDPSFTTVVDYAFTQIPAYAPREQTKAVTYSDETTHYYWAVLPATKLNGTGAAGDPLVQHPSSFQKRSLPPALALPRATVAGPQTFRWTAVDGARRYRLQVARDPNFGNLLDEVVTTATAYASEKIYPADAALYARVRAEDENLVGLTWSAPRTFRNLLPAPNTGSRNPPRGDELPTWTWSAVPGAVAYEIHIELPNGQARDFKNLRVPAVTPVVLTGTGVFHWQVRAEFPDSYGTVPGPFSSLMTFTRTIAAPAGAHTRVSAAGVLLSWQPKPGARSYRVEVSATPDFSTVGGGEKVTTDNAGYAPKLGSFTYAKGGTFYWRVAAVDNDSNVGNFTQPQTFQLRQPKKK